MRRGNRGGGRVKVLCMYCIHVQNCPKISLIIKIPKNFERDKMKFKA